MPRPWKLPKRGMVASDMFLKFCGKPSLWKTQLLAGHTPWHTPIFLSVLLEPSSFCIHISVIFSGEDGDFINMEVGIFVGLDVCLHKTKTAFEPVNIQ